MSLSHIGICTPNDYPTYVTSGRMSDLFFAEAVLGEPMRKKMAKTFGSMIFTLVLAGTHAMSARADDTGNANQTCERIGKLLAEKKIRRYRAAS